VHPHAAVHLGVRRVDSRACAATSAGVARATTLAFLVGSFALIAASSAASRCAGVTELRCRAYAAFAGARGARSTPMSAAF